MKSKLNAFELNAKDADPAITMLTQRPDCMKWGPKYLPQHIVVAHDHSLSLNPQKIFRVV